MTRRNMQRKFYFANGEALRQAAINEALERYPATKAEVDDVDRDGPTMCVVDYVMCGMSSGWTSLFCDDEPLPKDDLGRFLHDIAPPPTPTRPSFPSPPSIMPGTCARAVSEAR
jgi:hypothetical protein